MSDDRRVVAFMRARAEEVGAVRRAVLDCVEPSRAEAGNVMYAAHADTHDPLLFVVVEHWETAEARDRHLQSQHFKELVRQVDEAGRLTHHEFHVIVPL